MGVELLLVLQVLERMRQQIVVVQQVRLVAYGSGGGAGGQRVL